MFIYHKNANLQKTVFTQTNHITGYILNNFFVTPFNDIFLPYNFVINVYDLLLDVGSVHIANIDDTIHGNIIYNGYINNH